MGEMNRRELTGMISDTIYDALEKIYRGQSTRDVLAKLAGEIHPGSGFLEFLRKKGKGEWAQRLKNIVANPSALASLETREINQLITDYIRWKADNMAEGFVGAIDDIYKGVSNRLVEIESLRERLERSPNNEKLQAELRDKIEELRAQVIPEVEKAAKEHIGEKIVELRGEMPNPSQGVVGRLLENKEEVVWGLTSLQLLSAIANLPWGGKPSNNRPRGWRRPQGSGGPKSGGGRPKSGGGPRGGRVPWGTVIGLGTMVPRFIGPGLVITAAGYGAYLAYKHNFLGFRDIANDVAQDLKGWLNGRKGNPEDINYYPYGGGGRDGATSIYP